MMHALEVVLSIMIYRCIHDTGIWNGCVYRKHIVRLISAKGMIAIWHESLYHSGSNSRQTPTGLCKSDLRLFMYLWPFITNNQRNRNVGTSDGVAREYSEYLHRNILDTYMCKVFMMMNVIVLIVWKERL